MDFEGIPVRVYQPSTKGSNRPGLVYLHGGGYRMGTPCKCGGKEGMGIIYQCPNISYLKLL